MNVKPLLSASLLLLSCLSPPAQAAGNLSVNEQVMVTASADTVWNLIGDFGGLDKWHPGVASESVTGTGTRAGDTRVLKLTDGGSITEKLVNRDPAGRKYTYTIQDSPLPVTEYLSTLKVLPAGDNLSRVVWSATFDAARGTSAEDAMAAVRNVYSAGFQALVKRFQ